MVGVVLAFDQLVAKLQWFCKFKNWSFQSTFRILIWIKISHIPITKPRNSKVHLPPVRESNCSPQTCTVYYWVNFVPTLSVFHDTCFNSADSLVCNTLSRSSRISTKLFKNMICLHQISAVLLNKYIFSIGGYEPVPDQCFQDLSQHQTKS